MAVWPVIANALIGRYGWRSAYAMIGVASALVILPLMFALFRNAKKPVAGASDAPALPKTGLTLRQGLRTSQFARLTIAGTLMNIGLMALFVHFVPVLASTSISRTQAVALAGLIGVFSIVGRLTSGVLIDRFDGRLIGSVSSAMPIVGAFLLYLGGGPWTAIAASVLIGLSFGAEIDVIAYLASRYLGLKSFGALYGFIVSGNVFGSGFGPVLASYCYDTWKNYDAFLWISIAMFTVSMICTATLGRYPQFSE
jgi:predicted MFS family arabinose efflux permease